MVQETGQAQPRRTLRKKSELVELLAQEGWEEALEQFASHLASQRLAEWLAGAGTTTHTETEVKTRTVYKDPETGARLPQPVKVEQRVVVSRETRNRTPGETHQAGYRRRSELMRYAASQLRDIAYEWAIGVAEDTIIDGGDYDDFVDVVTGNESLPYGDEELTTRYIWEALTGQDVPELAKLEPMVGSDRVDLDAVPLIEYDADLPSRIETDEQLVRDLVDVALESEWTYGELMKAVFATVADQEKGQLSAHHWLKTRGLRGVPDPYSPGWEGRKTPNEKTRRKGIDPNRPLHLRVTSDDIYSAEAWAEVDGSNQDGPSVLVGGVFFYPGQDDHDDGEETGILVDLFEEPQKADWEMLGWMYGDEHARSVKERTEKLNIPTLRHTVTVEGKFERPDWVASAPARQSNGFGDALLGKGKPIAVDPSLVESDTDAPAAPKARRGRPKKEVLSNGFGAALLGKVAQPAAAVVPKPALVEPAPAAKVTPKPPAPKAQPAAETVVKSNGFGASLLKR